MTQTRAERMEQALAALQPVSLDINDDSARHAGHAGVQGVKGGETHYRIRIISAAFEGKSRIQRHRMVQALLEPEFDTGLHAVNIVAEVPL